MKDQQHEHDDPKRTAELERELRELLVAERDALRADGVRAEIYGDRVVTGRELRRFALWDRADRRAARRAELAARPKPPGATAVFVARVRALGGYEALDERSRAHFDAAEAIALERRPVTRFLSDEDVARRLERTRAREFARETLDANRALARNAGFRRLSRWVAAGSPIFPPAGRTPLPATRRSRAAR